MTRRVEAKLIDDMHRFGKRVPETNGFSQTELAYSAGFNNALMLARHVPDAFAAATAAFEAMLAKVSGAFPEALVNQETWFEEWRAIMESDAE